VKESQLILAMKGHVVAGCDAREDCAEGMIRTIRANLCAFSTPGPHTEAVVRTFFVVAG